MYYSKLFNNKTGKRKSNNKRKINYSTIKRKQKKKIFYNKEKMS